jgi:hypothetical protein
MPDEGFDPQPEVAARMAPQLRLTQAGNGVAVLALVFSLAAVFTFPDVFASQNGKAWAISALVASAVMLAICTFQHLAWLRAMAIWNGGRIDDLRPWRRVSLALHLLSYPVVLFGLWAGISGSVAAGTSATAAALLAFALLFLLLAQVLAGVQYLRTDGPPGTIPAYLRRLSEEIQRRR